MEITEADFDAAAHAFAKKREVHAVGARYDRSRGRVVVRLNTGVEVHVPTRLAQGLAGAPAEALADIRITPGGIGLHWAQLDADLHVPSLLKGHLGSEAWEARQSGAAGPRRAAQ